MHAHRYNDDDKGFLIVSFFAKTIGKKFAKKIAKTKWQGLQYVQQVYNDDDKGFLIVSR